MNSILEVKNLSRKFGKFTAVDDVSFHLKKGEILGLLGPNGAGKTTTIQMILGILNKTSGSIKYFGKDFESNKEEILEKINFSSTYINFPWDMTVSENMRYISYLYDIKDRKKRIAKLVELFDMTKIMNKQIKQLSEGQKTRMNLTKSFINFPEVVLLDEPTASLDPQTADDMRKFLLNQRKEFKTSMIFTSHNMAEVEEICDRVIFIDKGKIIAEDTPINLAKTIKTAHVQFVSHEVDKFENYAKANKINYERNDKSINLELNEEKIPDVLRDFAIMHIKYEEISIKKPNLEDYFLAIAKENKNKEDEAN